MNTNETRRLPAEFLLFALIRRLPPLRPCEGGPIRCFSPVSFLWNGAKIVLCHRKLSFKRLTSQTKKKQFRSWSAKFGYGQD
jgi:hypothetical protein